MTNIPIRLNKFISNAGICARREADHLIQQGKITVNGDITTTLGFKVTPNAIVKYRGQVLQGEKRVYILLNKPKKYVTTVSDPEKRKTVLDLISPHYCPERIYPVGRLDYLTTGLLLLTNDGDLATKLTHPANKVKKIYQITLNKSITSSDFNKIQQGIILEDGLAQVDHLAIIDNDRKCIGMAIHMGKNRIVRRIFEHLHYKVHALDRVGYANLTKKNLPRGKWHFLPHNTVKYLKYFATVS